MPTQDHTGHGELSRLLKISVLRRKSSLFDLKNAEAPMKPVEIKSFPFRVLCFACSLNVTHVCPEWEEGISFSFEQVKDARRKIWRPIEDQSGRGPSLI